MKSYVTPEPSIFSLLAMGTLAAAGEAPINVTTLIPAERQEIVGGTREFDDAALKLYKGECDVEMFEANFGDADAAAPMCIALKLMGEKKKPQEIIPYLERAAQTGELGVQSNLCKTLIVVLHNPNWPQPRTSEPGR